MSYDVYFVVDTGGDEFAEVGWRNYTSNVSGMWTKALNLPEKPAFRDDGERAMCHRPAGDGSWIIEPAFNYGMRLLHDAPASEAAGVLAAAVERMRANPDEYRAMNPTNGWGDYEGALDFLAWMAEMARKHPASVIWISS